VTQRRGPIGALFATINRDHFGGRLPAYRVRRVRRVPGTPEGPGCPDGLGRAATREIFIAHDLNPVDERAVLLHEMCHAATVGVDQDPHGAAFKAECGRLARRGEGPRLWIMAKRK
jgi:hypothetical protein